jgi:hypothetical protein
MRFARRVRAAAHVFLNTSTLSLARARALSLTNTRMRAPAFSCGHACCGITMHVRKEGAGKGNVRGEVGHHNSLVKLQHALSS